MSAQFLEAAQKTMDSLARGAWPEDAPGLLTRLALVEIADRCKVATSAELAPDLNSLWAAEIRLVARAEIAAALIGLQIEPAPPRVPWDALVTGLYYERDAAEPVRPFLAEWHGERGLGWFEWPPIEEVAGARDVVDHVARLIAEAARIEGKARRGPWGPRR